MLKLFRNKNVTKAVLWALLILILPAFVLWGTGNLGRSGDKGPTFAGTIGNRKVSFEDFYKSLIAARCQVIMNYYAQPKVLDTLLNNKELMGKLAWDRLLMASDAKRSGIRVTDAEVIAFIRSHPIFARGGTFDDKVYQYILRQNINVDPRSFEEIARQTIAIQKLNDNTTRGVTVTDGEVLEAYKRENRKYRLVCAVFAADGYKDRVGIDDAQVRDYYEAHKKEFVNSARPAAPEAGAASQEAGAASQGTGGVAAFDAVKDGIRAFLTAREARALALKDAEEKHGKITELMADKKTTFEDAALAEGLKVHQTPVFSRNDYLETIGEAFPLSDAAVKLAPDAISAPVEVRTGAVIFRIAEIREIDKDSFGKDRAGFARKVLDAKKMAQLEKWLKRLELAGTLNIDLKDYEKYYR